MRIIGLLAAGLLLAGCTPSPPTPETPLPPQVEQPTGEVTEITSGLAAPWSMVRLESGSTLISERDTAIVKELTAGGDVREMGQIPGVVPGGEGGLLGLEVVGDQLFAYFTAETDNRIERFDLLGNAGDYSLGRGEVILSGMEKAGNHNGGRIKLGPDRDLYVTVGDAGDSSRSQDKSSLNGKILRITVDGEIPADNPFPGSPVYSYGHRNPQGIAWDDAGQLYAAEFGQNTWDEFNRIVPGGNYGWPIVEGIANDPDYLDPVFQWSTDAASPSGLAYSGGTFFMAALRGERLWAIYPQPDSGASVTEYLAGEYGRLRDVTPGPDGSLWVLTNNTDGRGDPRDGDDRILQVSLERVVEGRG